MNGSENYSGTKIPWAEGSVLGSSPARGTRVEVKYPPEVGAPAKDAIRSEGTNPRIIRLDI